MSLRNSESDKCGESSTDLSSTGTDPWVYEADGRGDFTGEYADGSVGLREQARAEMEVLPVEAATVGVVSRVTAATNDDVEVATVLDLAPDQAERLGRDLIDCAEAARAKRECETDE